MFLYFRNFTSSVNRYIWILEWYDLSLPEDSSENLIGLSTYSTSSDSNDNYNVWYNRLGSTVVFFDFIKSDLTVYSNLNEASAGEY